MRKTLTLAVIAAFAAAMAACGGQQTTSNDENMANAGLDQESQTEQPYSQQEQAQQGQQAQQPAQRQAQTNPTPVPQANRMPATQTTSTPPPPPTRAMVTIPSGTVLEVKLLRGLSTEKNQAGDTFRVSVTDPVTMGGQTVIPAGTRVLGKVTESVQAKKMKGQASMTLAFSEMTLPDGTVIPVTAELSQKGKKMGKQAGGIIGGTAAGGALLGRIIGKDTKGAVKGALIGAAAGTAIAAAQDGQDITLPKGTALAIELGQPVSVPEPAGSN